MRAMEPHMALDEYGRSCIRNIYFDTDNYRLIRHSIEKTTYKEKLRIRSYMQATEDSTVFVELKKKYKYVVYKRRISMAQSEAMAWVCKEKHCHADDTLDVTGGDIHITESYEGLEALNLNVSGGDIWLCASDDGLNAAGGTDSSGTTGGRDGMFGKGMPSASNGSIHISGGSIYVTASGDGIDANGSIEITGGYTVVCGPTQGDTATLDYDTSAVISGGTFIGTGALGMAQSFSESGQGVIAVNVGGQSEGTQIGLTDSSRNEILAYTPELSFSVFIYSSPDIVKGESYTVLIGSDSGTVTAN